MEGIAAPGDPDLSVEIEEADGEVVVRVEGEIDTTSAERLEDALRPVLDRSAPPALVFDLAQLAFMDSSGIAVLLRAATRAASVRLRSPSRIIREVVRATGLGDVLTIEP